MTQKTALCVLVKFTWGRHHVIMLKSLSAIRPKTPQRLSAASQLNRNGALPRTSILNHHVLIRIESVHYIVTLSVFPLKACFLELCSSQDSMKCYFIPFASDSNTATLVCVFPSVLVTPKTWSKGTHHCWTGHCCFRVHSLKPRWSP